MVRGHYVNIISRDKNMCDKSIKNEKARPLIVYKVWRFGCHSTTLLKNWKSPNIANVCWLSKYA
jgi:hypothetical protein